MAQMEHVFLCELTHTGQRIAADTFPYGIGCIATYLEKNCSSPITTHLFKFPDEIFDEFVKFKPGIAGFSNYIWNFNLSKTMAEHMKKVMPETVVVFGGSNFPKRKDEQEEFLRSNQVIDFYIEGEGERAFWQLVERLYEHDFDLGLVKRMGSPSVRTLLDGEFLSYDLAPRFENLDEIPSPYLTGKMDKFFDQDLMPLIETNRGCPFSCTYCVQGDPYYSRGAKRTNKIVADEIEYIAKKATKNRLLYIADSNFGMYREDIEIAATIGQTMDNWDYPSYVHVTTGKNRPERMIEMARLLKGRIHLAGSVQTLDPVILDNIKRKNIHIEQLLELAESARRIGAKSYSDVILGLPGDSKEAHLMTMKGVIEAGFSFVVPFTLMLLMGSELATRDSMEHFGLESKYRILPRAFGIYKFGEKEFISGEVEKVSASSKTLSLDDYLGCRQFALTTALFYNDRFFEEVLETLKALDLSIFEWLNEIHNSWDAFPVKLKKVYNDFKKATLTELWDSREELLKFMSRRDNIKKLINGDLGFNVIHIYRARALSSVIKELNDVAFDSALKLISKGLDVFSQNREYFKQLRLFSLLRKHRLFDFEYTPEATFDYDFKRILEEHQWHMPSGEGHGGQLLYRFCHTPEQIRMAKEQIRIFGTSNVGMAKILTRIPLSEMYRKVEILSGVVKTCACRQ